MQDPFAPPAWAELGPNIVGVHRLLVPEGRFVPEATAERLHQQTAQAAVQLTL